MNQSARILGMVLICSMLLTTTGCWSNDEIEELNLYVGLGMDVAQESKFEKQVNEQGGHYPKKKNMTVTVQITPPSSGQKKNQNSSSPQGGKSYLNERLTGDSVVQILRQFALRRERPLIGHHLKVIVLSTELAKKYNLEQLLDYIMRDNDIRPSCLILISHGSAVEALNSSEPGEIPALYLTGLFDNRQLSNKILPAMSLAKLDGMMQSGSSFLLQNVITAEGEHKFSGAGIFKGTSKKWIGSLSQTDLEGLSWITGKVRTGALKTYKPRTGDTITYEPKVTKSKITPIVRGDQISFHVEVASRGALIEDWSSPQHTATESYQDELEGYFEDTVREQIRQVLYKMQETYHVDVAGFGEQLRIKHPRLWKKVEKNWDEAFSKANVTYDVKINITNYGSSMR